MAHMSTRSLVRGDKFKTDFSQAIRDINEGIQRSRLDSKSHFDHVSVLLLMWENDDLGAEKEVRALGETFSKRYGYAVSVGKIPHRGGDGGAYTWTYDTLREFKKKCDGPNNLMVVYYSGHAECPAPYDTLQML